MVSAARISILFFGLVAILLLGTWGWTALTNAVYRAEAGDIIIGLTVYGVASLVFAVVAGYTYLVIWFKDDAPD
ncbi:MAG: hypothetical protein F4X64_05350 [Chloroflexi bacterium]|nr:hypothetical protein [Chloroflexota bacterium]